MIDDDSCYSGFMCTQTAKPENLAKITILKYLQRSRKLRDAVIASEVVLSRSAVRADLVMFDRKLPIAFEIKTEKDSLKRLPSQIDAYLRYFPFFVLVVHRKHFAAAEQMLPRHAGIWVLDGVNIVEYRPARKRLPTKPHLVELLSISILRRLCRVSKSANSSNSRSELEKKAALLPRQHLIQCVVGMYRTKFAGFSEAVVANIASVDVRKAHLTKSRLFVRRAKVSKNMTAGDIYAKWLEDWSVSQSTQSSSSSSVICALSE